MALGTQVCHWQNLEGKQTKTPLRICSSIHLKKQSAPVTWFQTNPAPFWSLILSCQNVACVIRNWHVWRHGYFSATRAAHRPRGHRSGVADNLHDKSLTIQPASQPAGTLNEAQIATSLINITHCTGLGSSSSYSGTIRLGLTAWSFACEKSKASEVVWLCSSRSHVFFGQSPTAESCWISEIIGKLWKQLLSVVQ